MVEGLITKQEKPSNTEVLGMLIDPEKINFITKLTHENIEGIAKFKYFTQRLYHPEKDASEIASEVIEEVLALKCTVPDKDKGNQADKIVDALKHIIEDQNQDDIKNLAQQIKS